MFSLKIVSIYGEKWSPRGAQGDPQLEEFRGLFAPPLQDRPKDAKLNENDSKIEPKWSPHGVKME